MKITLYMVSALVVIVIIAQLVLARTPMPVTTTAVIWTYTVQHDDTLWVIAKRYYLNQDIRESVHNIRALNGFDATRVIRPGQRLKMPAGSNRVEVDGE